MNKRKIYVECFSKKELQTIKKLLIVLDKWNTTNYSKIFEKLFLMDKPTALLKLEDEMFMEVTTIKRYSKKLKELLIILRECFFNY